MGSLCAMLCFLSYETKRNGLERKPGSLTNELTQNMEELMWGNWMGELLNKSGMKTG